MRFLHTILIVLLPFIGINSSAQYKKNNTSFDASINIGAAAIQTDFGENGDFKSNVYGNVGFTIGGAFYMNFIQRRSSNDSHWFKNHAKLKGELSYLKANIDHFGSNIEGDNASAILFKKMHAKVSVMNFGAMMEYHIFDLSEYNPKNTNIFSPYVSFGGMVGFSSPTVYSDLGDYHNNPEVLPGSYRKENTIQTGTETNFSLAFGVGSRIKLSYNSDLVIDTRWQKYSSDRIDGLVPQYEANKNNDWIYSATLGYVFYLD
jgi:hypothetical protein